ncbi:hypothetical protein [Mesorhizobium sp. M0618]|uniref:hypothetical protein n=1 Tax=unclassified Mesorhizobium TaxID=325217 RepID=UPI00333B903A
MMDHADMPRQGDLDGRGNLSERALGDFTLWFLQVCIDQVSFMTGRSISTRWPSGCIGMWSAVV